MIELNGERLEQVNEFVYLGSMFDRNGRIDGEITRRVNAGAQVVDAMNKFARDERLSKGARMAVYGSVVVPVLMYGSETWVWQKRHRSRITACEMRYLRGVRGVMRRDCVRNEQVLEECGVKENVVQKVGKSALRWFGHVERMKERRIIEESVCGKSGWEAWQGESWLQQVDGYLKERKMMSQKKNVRKCARRGMKQKRCQNRKGWRKLLNG